MKKTNVDDIVRTQYDFARWFDKMLLNSQLWKAIDAYERALHVVEEAIETMRCCDSRKSWKTEYKLIDENEVKEEIIDVFKYTMNWIIDLSANKIEDEERLPELVKENLNRLLLWWKSKNWELTLKNLLDSVLTKFSSEWLIFPTKNIWVKEWNTIFLVRKIIKVSSRLEPINVEDLINAKWQWLIEKYNKEALEIYSEILSLVLMCWIIWTTNSNDDESIIFSEDEFMTFFNSKSEKNINRQVIWTSEYKEHNQN